MPSQWTRWKNVMKAVPFEEKRLLKWSPPFIVQPKYDGVRCRAVPTETSGYLLLSSEENVIYSVPHLNLTFNNLRLTAEFDGELYCHGMTFEQIISITSRTINMHSDSEQIKFHLFDIICEEPQMRRSIILENLRGISSNIVVAPFYLCETLDEIMRAYDSLVSAGYEGIIVRHKLNMYERKRSTMVMKFKPKKEDEYEIIGYDEEVSISGVAKGSLGALRLISGDGNIFSVGTGYTEETRRLLWEDREKLIGRIARIKYQHLTSGKQVPRFPVFVEIMKGEEDD